MPSSPGLCSKKREGLLQGAPERATVIEGIRDQAAWLWERRPGDRDFLDLRAGLCRRPSKNVIDFAPGGSESLRREATDMLARHEWLTDAPLSVSVRDAGVLGLTGERRRVDGLARWFLLQAAALHSPLNLAIAAAVPAETATSWSWLKWLPHTEVGLVGCDGPLLAADTGACRELVDRLASLIELRSEEIGPYKSRNTPGPNITLLVLLHEDLAVSRDRLKTLLAEGPRVGVLVLWIGSRARDLPNEARAILETSPDGAMRLTRAESGQVTEAHSATDWVDPTTALQTALDLAALRDTSGSDIRVGLPRLLGLMELLQLPPRPDAKTIQEAWAAQPDDVLSAVVGVTEDGPLTVDLRADGPHGLVAGTTGSGKSELLQTVVASLAVSNPPTRLNFLLIDYKGGSAFKDAVRLPHTVGLVTDLDGHLARRVLVSLRAELRRREELLRRAAARDLMELSHQDPRGCPPSLCIVVDEFAALAQELPEFVAGVVDLAQRGRSLGLHLLLATQRPAGVVSESIRANTNLRICLRVAAEADSADVIGSGDAARLPRGWAGRGYIRTGHAELRQFQAAYSAAGPADPAGPLSVEPIGFHGGIRATRPGAQADKTDLHRLTEAISAAAKALDLPAAPRPWLPELPPLLSLSALAGVAAGNQGVHVGLVDLPDRQLQTPWLLDFETQGSLLIYGAPGAGKTTFLCTLAVALARSYAPSDLHIYGLDGGTGGLSAIQELPHCGSVVHVDDTERAMRLLAWLRHEIDSRKAAHAPAPALVTMVDGYGAFAAIFEKVDHGEWLDAFARLVVDGRGVGVHFAITADRRAAVPGSVHSAVGSRLVLRMNDEDDYRVLGVNVKDVDMASVVPGRGWLTGGKEVQCAVVDSDAAGERQGDVIRLEGQRLRGPHPESRVHQIRRLPKDLRLDDVPKSGRTLCAAFGLRDADLGPAIVDLAAGHFLVSGPRRSGRSTALATLARSLGMASPSLEAVLLAPRPTPLTGIELWAEVAHSPAECLASAARVMDAIEARIGDDKLDPLLVVVDDGEDLTEGALAAMLEAITKRGRDCGVRLVAAIESYSAQRAFTGWIPELKRGRRGLLLQPDMDLDGEILAARLVRRGLVAMPTGRGFLVEDGVAELVQVAH